MSSPISRLRLLLSALTLFTLSVGAQESAFDAAPFALPLPEGNGLLWEDPREIHRVVVHFADAAPALEKIRLEYWGSRWPDQHLPKDREPGGADVGWMELGNWWKGGWRVADAEAKADANALTFTFRPVNAKEFPNLKGYDAPFRYTLKLRLAPDQALPRIETLEAFTDSLLAERSFNVVFEKRSSPVLLLQAFNGSVQGVTESAPAKWIGRIRAATNSDPNTFDRTLVTVRNGQQSFTFKFDDLAQGPLILPDFGAAVLPEADKRDYAAVAAEAKGRGGKTLYDRIAEMPEQTWSNAWAGLPRKKSDIYFPLGLDGGRQRFRLEPDGSIRFRSNDNYLQHRPGKDTPRLELEPAEVVFRFGSFPRPTARTLEEESLPICHTTWETNGLRVTQTTFVTELYGAQVEQGVPPADTTTVLLARFVFANGSQTEQTASLVLSYDAGGKSKGLRIDEKSLLWLEQSLRGQVVIDAEAQRDQLVWKWALKPGESKTAFVKIPYVVLTQKEEHEALAKLDFEVEHKAVAGYWRRRLDESARLITPEPMLNEFYRSDAMHLLVNCEREPNAERRFARVGSFHYGAYGNESCMMVVDLDRRGYHKEAQECLDGWLHYQGTVELPGSFESKEGVLYGAGGYEAGGYNQHHGWILWMIAEHYRFTRDEAWLRGAVSGIVAASDWIIRETARTQERHELERGLLPSGSLEDIGDWWTWLSTTCYTWRGLDSAAWALEQLKHPEAKRVRAAADAYHSALLKNFRAASERSPVVRLRDGTAIPQIPSHMHRRGRTFGWICQTLEGAIHLLITGAIDPHSQEAEWIIKDYEDNLYLSNQYGYTVTDFEKHWFGRGGMSMQACLLLDVEPYLYRDEPKHALRALFNAQSVSYFPDVRMNTEHAAPYFDDWRGDHFKSSDESNCCGWLRYLFVREEGDTLLIGQAAPREWLRAGQRCGIERTATYFGKTSVLYTGGENEITASLDGPQRNPPKQIRLRFREPNERPLKSVTVNGKAWERFKGEWVELPGDIGTATIVAEFAP